MLSPKDLAECLTAIESRLYQAFRVSDFVAFVKAWAEGLRFALAEYRRVQQTEWKQLRALIKRAKEGEAPAEAKANASCLFREICDRHRRTEQDIRAYNLRRAMDGDEDSALGAIKNHCDRVEFVSLPSRR